MGRGCSGDLGAQIVPHFPCQCWPRWVSRVSTLVEADRPEEALVVHEDILKRFGASEQPVVVELVTNAFFNCGRALARLNRLNEAIYAWNEVSGTNR